MKNAFHFRSALSVRFFYLFSMPIIISTLILPSQVFSANPEINEIMASNNTCLLDPDFNQFADWIELHNTGTSDLSLAGYSLSNDLAGSSRWPFPAGVSIPANGYIIVYADGNDSRGSACHTNFKLKKGGESLWLFNPSGSTVDSVRFENQIGDISYGRQGNGSTWVYFSNPTPGKSNDTSGIPVKNVLANPQFSIPGGLYATDITVVLSHPDPGSTIRYSLDGSIPTDSSAIYTGPFTLSATTVIRARAFKSGFLPSETVTQSYFIREDVHLPVVSIVTNPLYMWDNAIGIYNDLNIASRTDWLRPVDIEMFQADGRPGFKTGASLQLFGNSAFYYPEKSFDVSPDNPVLYRIFPAINRVEYKTFILRSSSDDWPLTMFRDGMIQLLTKDYLHMDYQAYRPSVVFINGAYFGIHNIREKNDQYSLAADFGIDPKLVDLLFLDLRTSTVKTLTGNQDAYSAFMNYVSTHTLTGDAEYQTLQTMMDIDNFIDWMIAESYTGNISWNHNIRIWRSQTADAKWRWIQMDFDRGFINTGQGTLGELVAQYPLVAKLLANTSFKNKFISRFVEVMNTMYQPDRVIGIVDSLQNDIRNEMPRHILRWKGFCAPPIQGGACGIASMTDWENNVEVMRNFAKQRGANVRQQLQTRFGLAAAAKLIIAMTPAGAGEVSIDSSTVIAGNYSGYYFRNTQVRLIAKPLAGYSFAGWSGSVTSSDPNCLANMTGDLSLTATFILNMQNQLPSIIQRDTVLTLAGSPYIAKTNVVVSPNVRLTMDAGVEIRLDSGKSLIVNGALSCNGLADKPIRLVSNTPGSAWGAIVVNNSTDSCAMRNIELTGASQGTSGGASVECNNSRLVLDHMTITNCGQPFNATHCRSEMRNCIMDNPHPTQESVVFNYSTAVIENCAFSGFGQLDLNYLDTCIVRGCHITSIDPDPNADGIDFGSTHFAIVENNFISNVADKGISVGEGTNVIIKGNTIVRCDKAVAVKDASVALIDGNTFYLCRRSVDVYQKTAGLGGGHATVVNTIFSKSTEADCVTDALSTAPISYSLSDRQLITGQGNIYDDPMFTAPATNDFHLRPGSPCIDAGSPSSPVDRDGSRADIGALPYNTMISDLEQVKINEIMAKNKTFASDESGKYGDWIELYNGNTKPIDVGGLYLTDNINKLLVHRVPTDSPQVTTIPAGGFCTFWADGDSTRGIFHLKFKLNNAGETVCLVYKDGTEPVILDSLRYSSLGSDESFGRTPDGGENLGKFANPTPAFPNFSGSNTYFHETMPATDTTLFLAGQSQATFTFYWTRPVLSEASLSGILYALYFRNLRTGTDSIYYSNATEFRTLNFTQGDYGEYRWHVVAMLADGRRLLTESRGFTLSTVSGVKTNRIPDHFALSAPYPNPFNPSTMINYQLPSAGHVTLKVFDMLGREVATLVDGMKDAGYYTATFDGSRFSSGVYFVHITAIPQDGSQSFTKTMKMLMMK